MSKPDESFATPSSSVESLEAAPRSTSLPTVRHRDGGELGRGGMARVTSGFDPVLERTVALKRSLGGTPAEDARLLREAKLTAQLDHPAIASVLDVGLDANGALVAVLHVRQGESFVAAVKTAPRAALLRALLTASQALAHAHARGVLHRDVSPNNVRLGADGAVWVLDWGLAATLDEAKVVGFRGGTAGSMSPEQRRGEALSKASDVWSLGALLHLLCVGALPSGQARPSSCPRPLWAVCQRALSELPSQRYVDAGAFAAELARWLDGQPLEAWPEGPVDRLARVASHWPRLTVAVIGVLVLGLVAVTAVLRAQRDAKVATAKLLLDSAERALAVDDGELARSLAKQSLSLHDDVRAKGVLAVTSRLTPVRVTALKRVTCDVRDVVGDEVQCGADELVRFASGEVVEASQSKRTLSLGRAVVREVPGGVTVLRVNATRTSAVLAVPEAIGVITADGIGPFVRPCTPGQPVRFAVPYRDGALVVCADDELVTVEPREDEQDGFVDGSPLAADQSRAMGLASVRANNQRNVDASSRTSVQQTADARRLGTDQRLAPPTAVEPVTTESRLRRRHVNGLGTLLRGAVSGDLMRGDTLLIATADGHLGVIELETAELKWTGATGLGLIHSVVASADGRSAVLLGERGDGVFRIDEGYVVTIPSRLERAWRSGNSEFVATSKDGSLVKLRVDAALGLTHGLHGRSALAVNEDRVAVGDAFGVVQLAHLKTGVQRTRTGPTRVIKSLAFSSDGRFLALGAAGPDGFLVFDAAFHSIPTPWTGDAVVRARHVAFMNEDTVVHFGWGAPPRAARFDETAARFVEVPLPLLPGDVRDVACRVGACWLVDADSKVHQLTLHSGVFNTTTTTLVAERIAVSPSGEQLATAAGRFVSRRFGEPLEAGGDVESLAIADDGRLAVCRRDGVVRVMNAKGELVYEAPAHEQRCARVTFCDAQRAVCSVGWDGRLRVLDSEVR